MGHRDVHPFPPHLKLASAKFPYKVDLPLLYLRKSCIQKSPSSLVFLPGVQAEVGSGITSITNIRMDEVNEENNGTPL